MTPSTTSRFLGHLLDRAEGRLPRLERRQRSLFEPPVAWSAASVPDLHSEVEAAPFSPPQPERREATINPSLRQSPLVTPPPGPTARETLRTTTVVTPAPSVVAAAALAATPAPAEGRSSQKTVDPFAYKAAPRSVTAPAPPTLLPASPLRTPTAATVQPSERIADRTPAPKAPEMSRPLVRERNRPAEAAPPTPRQATQVPVQTPPAALRVPQRRDNTPAILMARAQSTPRTALPAAAPAAPAPVHISIGRVEVRAQAPTAERPSRQARGNGPQLKLEDYLRERSRSGS